MDILGLSNGKGDLILVSRKTMALLAALVLMAVCVKMYMNSTLYAVPVLPHLKQCERTEDCVAVAIGCHCCEGNGFFDAANKDKAAILASYGQCLPEEQERCKAVQCEARPLPAVDCVQNVCVAKTEPAQAENGAEEKTESEVKEGLKPQVREP